MWYKILLVTVTIMLLSGNSFADELVLNNGNRLNGKIVSLADGKLKFKSDLAGDITVPIANIQTLSSDEPVNVILKDQTYFSQRLLTSTEGRFSIPGSDTLGAQSFAVADIASINKPAPKWTGSVSANISVTQGNTETQSFSASGKMSKRTDNDRTTLSADYAESEQKDQTTGEDETIEDWWRLKAKYDYFFAKTLYGYLDGRYETDAIAELDRRVLLGAGFGYQWVETDDLKFSTEAGIASLYEKYDTESDSTSTTSVQLGYNLQAKLVKNLSFLHDLTYYPSTEDFSDYYLTTTGEIRADLSSALFLNGQIILNYDSTPAPGKDETDTKYILGVGYSF